MSLVEMQRFEAGAFGESAAASIDSRGRLI